jgi:hypothetical protein
MRSMVSILIVALIALGGYYFYLKHAAPGAGMVATQAISTTGVEMDLLAIAQAERSAYAQNGSYASLDQLASSGAMTVTRSGRGGYTYAVETSGGGFMVTARHPDVPAATAGAPPLHYPTIMVDQTMQVRQTD